MAVIWSKKNILILIIIIMILLLFYKSYANTNYITREVLSIQTKPVMKQVIVATMDKTEREKIILNVEKSLESEGIASATLLHNTYEGYEVIAILNIPSIGIEYPVLAETSDELMKISLTKYWGGNPNEVGNFCIIGHNYKSGKHFGELKNVKKGENVLVTDYSNRTLTYEIYDIDIISPYDTRCTSQLTNGRKEVTLITCTNGGDNRLVVKAREV